MIIQTFVRFRKSIVEGIEGWVFIDKVYAEILYVFYSEWSVSPTFPASSQKSFCLLVVDLGGRHVHVISEFFDKFLEAPVLFDDDGSVVHLMWADEFLIPDLESYNVGIVSQLHDKNFHAHDV